MRVRGTAALGGCGMTYQPCIHHMPRCLPTMQSTVSEDTLNKLITMLRALNKLTIKIAQVVRKQRAQI